MVPQSEQGKRGGVGAGATGFATNGLPRPQSSLELLSQTAAVLELSPQPAFAHSSSNNSIVDLHLNFGTVSSSSSPKETARGVTPPNCFPTVLNMANRAPSLPDMIKKQNPTPPVILEQKRSSFLPPSLLGEGAPPDGGTDPVDGRAETPLHYSPGLLLFSYSNGSASTGIWNHGGGGGGHAPPPIATATDTGSSDAGSGDAVVPNFLTSQGSFTSSGSLASAAAPSYTYVGNSVGLGVAPPAFVPPQRSFTQTAHSFSSAPDDYQHENLLLRHQLAIKDATINSLQKQVDSLQQEIRELRQLPTGKISHIPVEDMLALMREYGSEVSDTAMPPRKQNVQKASVVRQFRRWNPNFLDWFEYRNGQWVPKLGKEGELERREQTRREAAEERRKKNHGQKQVGSDDSVKSESI